MNISEHDGLYIAYKEGDFPFSLSLRALRRRTIHLIHLEIDSILGQPIPIRIIQRNSRTQSTGYSILMTCKHEITNGYFHVLRI